MNNMMIIDPYTTALPHVTQCDKKTNINCVDIIAKVIVSLHKIKATLISSGALIIETLTNQSDVII